MILSIVKLNRPQLIGRLLWTIS